MPTLTHDDNAAGFFGITVLALYVVPASIHIFRTIRGSSKTTESKSAKARTSLEAARLRKLEEEEDAKKKLWTTGFKTYVGITAAAAVFLVVLLMTTGAGELAQYDPYGILGIAIGASEREIKAAYRRMSLQYHPDKPGGDAEMFQKVAKAYEALTDPDARRNYELYGNPDGRQALEVSIGLPGFLSEGIGRYLLLFSYIGVLAVVVPYLMFRMYKKSAAEADRSFNNLHKGTVSWIVSRVTPDMSPIRMLECLAGCVESVEWEREKGLRLSPEDVEWLKKTYKELANSKRIRPHAPIERVAIPTELVVRNYMLLQVHINRRALSPELRQFPATVEAILTGMLRQLDAIGDIMYKVCMERTQQHLIQEERRKRGMDPGGPAMPSFFATMRDVVVFKQMLTQAINPERDSSLLAILPAKQVERIAGTGVAKKDRIDNLYQYLSQPASERPEFSGPADGSSSSGLAADGSISTKKEFDAVVRDLPLIETVVSIAVAGEEYIAEKDVITATITLKHKNMTADACCDTGKSHSHDKIQRSKAGGCCDGDDHPTIEDSGAPTPPVFAPLFPFPKKEEWFIIIVDNNQRLVAQTSVSDLKATTSVKLLFPAPEKAGKHEYTIHVMSGNYMGLDQELHVAVEVRPASEVPRYEEAEEDAELGKSKDVALEGMMLGGNEDDSDVSEDEDDGSDSDDSADNYKPKATPAASKAAKPTPSASTPAPAPATKAAPAPAAVPKSKAAVTKAAAAAQEEDEFEAALREHQQALKAKEGDGKEKKAKAGKAKGKGEE